MDKELMKIIKGIAVSIAIIFSIFVIMGGNRLLEPLVYSYQNPQGGGLGNMVRVVPALIIAAVFLMAVMLTKISADAGKGENKKDSGKQGGGDGK